MSDATVESKPKRVIKGVRPMTTFERRFQKGAVLFITIVPMLGLAAAVWFLWGNGLAWSDVVAFVVMYLVTTLGVTVGFHRMLTHASFRTSSWLRTSWAVAGSMAVEGPVLTWVADHRRHHAHSDEEGDPHSPHVHEGDGLLAVLGGLWHAHVGWLFKKEASQPERWCADIYADPAIRRVDQLFFPLVAVSYVLPALIGLALTGTWIGAFSAFLWGGLVRMFVLHHVTWSINSICHFFGQRPYESGDESTNNWPLAILSMGESWHNNHHAFPSSAYHGLRWYQVDISAYVIRVMAALRLVRDVKRPSVGAMERKAKSPVERRSRKARVTA